MGYELHLGSAEIEGERLKVTIENRGVAPFYSDWPVQLRAGKVIDPGWKLSDVLPGKPVVWSVKVPREAAISIQVPNPMKGGRDLRFANDGYEDGWLKLR